MVTNISQHLRSLALGSYKAQELLCSRKLKMIRLLCGWKLKPKELLCTDILVREEYVSRRDAKAPGTVEFLQHRHLP